MTLSLLLLPYAVVVILFIMASLIYLGHLLRYGVADFSLAVVLIIFLLVSSSLLVTSFRSLSAVDWSMPLEFGSSRVTSPFFFNR